MSSFWGLVEEAAERRGSAPVAEDERGRVLTAAGLRERAEEVAAVLHRAGTTPGDVVAWQLPSSIAAIVTMAGLARLGVVQVPLVPIYRFREVSFAMCQTQASLLVVPPRGDGFDHVALAEEVRDALGGFELLLVDDDTIPRLPRGDRDAVDDLPEAPRGSDTLRWVFYTSGTTADPKGARHTDATLLGGAAGFVRRVEYTDADRAGVTFPLSHIGGPTSLAAALLAGFTMVLSATFDPVATPAFFRERRVTTVSGPPIVHQAFVDAQRVFGPERVFPDVRAFLGGGTPKPAGLSEALRDEVGAPLLSGYGATESPLATFCAPDDPAAMLDATEGRPCEGVAIRIVTADERLATAGEDGEIRLRGRQTFLGYMDDALNADAFDADGWFRSGDIGHLDSDGNVVVTGRIKEIIIRKGENLSAREILDVVLLHPDVVDAAVIGLPDPRTGERACAVVVLRPGTELSLGELAAHGRAHGLMNQKLPEQLEVLDELPRNAMGKVMVAALRERFGASPTV